MGINNIVSLPPKCDDKKKPRTKFVYSIKFQSLTRWTNDAVVFFSLIKVKNRAIWCTHLYSGTERKYYKEQTSQFKMILFVCLPKWNNFPICISANGMKHLQNWRCVYYAYAGLQLEEMQKWSEKTHTHTHTA